MRTDREPSLEVSRCARAQRAPVMCPTAGIHRAPNKVRTVEACFPECLIAFELPSAHKLGSLDMNSMIHGELLIQWADVHVLGPRLQGGRRVRPPPWG